MDFEYTTTIRIYSTDLREIYLRVKKGEDFYDVFYDVVAKYDDGEYYNMGYIVDDVKKEIDRRLAQTNFNKKGK